MGNAVRILGRWFREFVPALKTECIIVGVGLILMSLCLWVVAASSGLTGKLTYLAFHPGTDIPGIIIGVILVWLAMTWKPIPRDQM
jgi:hypothetical protein